MELHLEPVNIALMIERIMSTFGPGQSGLVAGKTVHLSCKFCPEEVPPLMLDKLRMRQGMATGACEGKKRGKGRPLHRKKTYDHARHYSNASLLLDAHAVLYNICGNACKFTTHGSVHVSVEFCDGWLRAAVKDTGPGIPEDQLSKLFQVFSQADASRTKRRYGGTGLGLVISKQLVEVCATLS